MLDQRKSSQRTRPVLNRNFGFDPFGAAKDGLIGLMRWRIWTSLAWQEFSSIYHRTLFGVVWGILSFAAFVFVKLIIFSSMLATGIPGYYDTYLLLGFFAWFYLQGSISSAPDTFWMAQSWIKAEALPLTVYIYKSVLRELYGLVLTAIVVVAGMLYIGFPVTGMGIAQSLLAIPFFILSANSTKLLLGIIGARFRDTSHLVKAIMLPMMFLTPIFWLPSQMPTLMKYLWWNPLYHYLEIFRAPLLDARFPTESWIFVLTVFAIVTVLAAILFSKFRQRIVFWL